MTAFALQPWGSYPPDSEIPKVRWSAGACRCLFHQPDPVSFDLSVVCGAMVAATSERAALKKRPATGQRLTIAFFICSRRLMRGANWETEVPPGWTAASGLLEPDPSIAGHLARGEEVKGFCDQKDCRRRCHVDLERMVARGFGVLPVAQAKKFMQCGVITGCGLDFHVDRTAGLRLSALLGRAHVRIRIKCQGCGFFRAAKVESIIAKLSTGTVRGGDLLTTDIRSRISGPCKTCRKSSWRVDVLWPNVESAGYRRSLET
jgi:hypothetical protein